MLGSWHKIVAQRSRSFLILFVGFPCYLLTWTTITSIINFNAIVDIPWHSLEDVHKNTTRELVSSSAMKMSQALIARLPQIRRKLYSKLDSNEWRTKDELNRIYQCLNLSVLEKRVDIYIKIRNNLPYTKPNITAATNCSGDCRMTTVPPRLDIGLGNLMFQVAALLGVALNRSFTPFLTSVDKLPAIFRLTGISLDMGSFEVDQAQVIRGGPAGKFQPRVMSLPANQHYLLTGYYQSYKYFHNYQDQVRQLFTFHPNLVAQGDRMFQQRVASSGFSLTSVFIGVHIRRGDFAFKSSLKRGFAVADKQYLVKAIKYFEARFTGVVFVVCSNDMLWSKKILAPPKKHNSSCHGCPGNRTTNLNGTNFLPNITSTVTGSLTAFNVLFMDGYRYPELDLYILSKKCHHTIMTVGSFGWWAAYLNQGQVVYYKDFPRPNSSLATEYNKDDYYLPEWVGI